MKRIISVLLIVSLCFSMLALISCGEKTNMEKLIKALAKDKIPMNEITFSESNGVNRLNSPNGTFHYEEGTYYIDFHKDFKQTYGYFADVVEKESVTIKGGKNYCVANQTFHTSTYEIKYTAEGNVMDVKVVYTLNEDGYAGGYFGWNKVTEYELTLEGVSFDVWAADSTVTYEEIKDSVSAPAEGKEAPTEAILTTVAANITAILDGMNNIGNTYECPMR